MTEYKANVETLQNVAKELALYHSESLEEFLRVVAVFPKYEALRTKVVGDFLDNNHRISQIWTDCDKCGFLSRKNKQHICSDCGEVYTSRDESEGDSE